MLIVQKHSKAFTVKGIHQTQHCERRKSLLDILLKLTRCKKLWKTFIRINTEITSPQHSRELPNVVLPTFYYTYVYKVLIPDFIKHLAHICIAGTRVCIS